MSFTTDKQTLDDLSIFGNYGEHSIYNIFNRCATRGGAAILEEMFRYPLSNEEAINRRCGIIHYFASAGTAFPFTTMHFDATEAYLSNNDERTRLTATKDTLEKRLNSLVASDDQTVQIHKGIRATVSILQECNAFINGLSLPGAHYYDQEKAAMQAIVTAPQFAAVLECKGKIPDAGMVAFDKLFRFQYRQEIQQLLRYIYHLDVYISVAGVSVERGYHFPKALPPHLPVLHLQEVFHPLVQHAVPNTITISADDNLVFLTGANMAGKSTFMKSVTIALFLAHTGLPVPAAAMEFSVMDGIYTTINLPDNLGMGASHFYAEVLRVKKMVLELESGKKLFIVFDELFRGTNVKDAYEATIAISQGFALNRSSIYIISTHIIEAGEVLREKCSNIHFVYLPTKMNNNIPVYTYRLEKGISADRHGMVIIQNEGILDILQQGAHKQIYN